MVASVRSLAKSILHKYGYDIRYVGQATLSGFLESRNVDLVIDVGAHIGHFAKKIRERGYKGAILSFEPQKIEFEALQQNSKADKAWSAYNVALSDESREGALNISEVGLFSSLHDINDSAIEFHSGSRVVRTERVLLKRLDEFAEAITDKTAFLKIDVQGHERAVLEGASGILDRIVGVQLELPVISLYQCTWRLPEALTFMEQLGFAPCQMTPVNFHTTDPASFVEVDMIFRRTR